MRGHQDGRAVPAQIGKRLHQPEFVTQVQVRAGLVQQKHARFLRQGARDEHQLPLPAAKLVHIRAGKLRDARAGQRLTRRQLIIFSRRAKQRQVRRAAEQDVFQHRVGIGLALGLRHQRDAPAQFRAGIHLQRAVFQQHLPG